MLRPFRIVFTRSDAPQTARIHVVFKELLGETRARTVKLFFGEVSAFMHSGALSGEGIHPASLAPQTSPPAISAVTATQVWTGLALPLDAVPCLLNMLEWLHHQEAPILEAQVAWDTRVLPAIANHAAFPAAWPQLGFELSVDAAREGPFAIAIEFCEHQPIPYVDQVLHEVGVWFTAVNRGAYGDARCPPASCCLELTDEAVEMSTRKIVIFVDRFRAHESALFGLANVVERIHHTLVRIQRLTVS